MTAETREGLFDRLCATHKEESDGREHLVLVDICTCGRVRSFRSEPLATNELSMGAIWVVGDTVHFSGVTRTPCFRKSS